MIIGLDIPSPSERLAESSKYLMTHQIWCTHSEFWCTRILTHVPRSALSATHRRADEVPPRRTSTPNQIATATEALPCGNRGSGPTHLHAVGQLSSAHAPILGVKAPCGGLHSMGTTCRELCFVWYNLSESNIFLSAVITPVE